MSKHHKNSETQGTQATQTAVTESTTAAPAVELVTEETAVAPVTEKPLGALAVIKPDDNGTLAYMANILPKAMAKSLRETRLVTSEELDDALAKLPEQYVDAFASLLRKLNPSNEYMDSSNSGVGRLDLLKIDQAQGDDKARSDLSAKGSIYSSPEGVLFTMPNEAKAKAMKLPMSIEVIPLAMYVGRTFFAPKVNGVSTPPEGVELHGNAPICQSRDRVMGNYYGECRTCAYRPFAAGTADSNACKDNVDLFVMLSDLSGIYRIQVAATSFKTCTQIIEQKLKGTLVPWERSFLLSTSTKARGKDEVFCVWNAAVKEDESGKPKPTAVEIRPLLGLIARQIRTEVHLPQMASIYAKASELSTKATATVVEKANVSEIVTNINTDYSQGSGNV